MSDFSENCKVSNGCVTYHNDSNSISIEIKSTPKMSVPLNNVELTFKNSNIKIMEFIKKNPSKVMLTGDDCTPNTIEFTPRSVNQNLNRDQQVDMVLELEKLLTNDDDFVNMSKNCGLDDNVIISTNLAWVLTTRHYPKLTISTLSMERFKHLVHISEKYLNENPYFKSLKNSFCEVTFKLKPNNPEFALTTKTVKDLFNQNLKCSKGRVNSIVPDTKTNAILVSTTIPDNIILTTRQWYVATGVSNVLVSIEVSLISKVDPMSRPTQLQNNPIPCTNNVRGTPKCTKCPDVDLLDNGECRKCITNQQRTPNRQHVIQKNRWLPSFKKIETNPAQLTDRRIFDPNWDDPTAGTWSARAETSAAILSSSTGVLLSDNSFSGLKLFDDADSATVASTSLIMAETASKVCKESNTHLPCNLMAIDIITGNADTRNNIIVKDKVSKVTPVISKPIDKESNTHLPCNSVMAIDDIITGNADTQNNIIVKDDVSKVTPVIFKPIDVSQSINQETDCLLHTPPPKLKRLNQKAKRLLQCDLSPGSALVNEENNAKNLKNLNNDKQISMQPWISTSKSNTDQTATMTLVKRSYHSLDRVTLQTSSKDMGKTKDDSVTVKLKKKKN